MIDVAQNLGHEVLLDIVAGAHHAVTRVKPDELPKEGERRPFEFDMNSVYFFDPATGANIEMAANASRAMKSPGAPTVVYDDGGD